MKKILLRLLFLFIVLLAVYYFWPEPSLPPGTTVDRLVVIKSRRVLQAYSKDRLLKTYPVSLGKTPEGKKACEGDGKTPEGSYTISSKNAGSGYHKNLGISYPDKRDREQAAKAHLSPGGDVKIHGLPNGWGFIGKFQRWVDWTNGCIALTDEEVDELFLNVRTGTPIEIRP